MAEDSPLADDLRKLVDLDRKKKALKAEAEAAGAKYQRHEAAVFEKFDAEYGAEIKTITVDLGEGYGTMRFGRRTQIYGAITDEAKARESLRELGLEDAMFQTKPFKKALNDFVKGLLESEQAFPDGIDFSERKIISKQSA